MVSSYTKSVTCAICGIRKPRRFCPGVKGDICTLCCGTGREETVDCPLDCEYLHEAHLHERIAQPDPESVPNGQVEIPDSFLEAHEWLLLVLSAAIIDAARQRPGITDYDLREALERLVRSYQALQSGLLYDAAPVNPYAAAVCDAVQQKVAGLREREADAGGSSTLPDATILYLLIFLQRLEYLHNNGRKRSRAFLDFLSQFFRAVGDLPKEESDVEPPRVILQS